VGTAAVLSAVTTAAKAACCLLLLSWLAWPYLEQNFGWGEVSFCLERKALQQGTIFATDYLCFTI
jgi:hypothetical protein